MTAIAIIFDRDPNSTSGVAAMIVAILVGLGALPDSLAGSYLRHRSR